MSKKNSTTTVETPVGPRVLAEGQPWWKGNGRGHIREFIPTEGEQVCARDGESHPETAFPTFTVPRKDGRTRGTICRDCVAEVREENAARAKRQEAARKAAATRAANKAKKGAKAKAA